MSPTVLERTLSQEDKRTLYTFGQILGQDAVGLIWETAFQTMYSMFFVLAVWSIVRKGLASRASRVLLCVVVYLYAAALALWALDIAWWFRRIHAFLMDHPDMSLAERRAQGDRVVAGFGTPMEAIFLINILLGDSIVIWRAWVLYPRMRWVLLVPCLMLFISSFFAAVDIACLSIGDWAGQTTIASGGPVCARAELMSWGFSFITNATCTILSATKRGSTGGLAARSADWKTPLGCPQSAFSLSSSNLASFIVYSGYASPTSSTHYIVRSSTSQLTQLILFFEVPRASGLIYVYEVFAGTGDELAGIYPTLIVVVVNLNLAAWERSPTNTAISSVQFDVGEGSESLDATTIRCTEEDAKRASGAEDVMSEKTVSRGGEQVV
ncbi:hypothetical protein DFH09DRAFT_1333783 [Mycena vulgaris]|nr:hypothetical protein DFH09DRAFT_1333783 [Mycena vulgaris]